METLSKIGGFIAFGLLGLFLGVWLGVFFFASAHFMRYFTIWALAIFAFVFLLNLKNLFKTNRKNKYLGLIFSTIFGGTILCGIAGIGWLLAGEDVNIDFVDSVIFLIIVPITSIFLGIYIPLRYILPDTRISQTLSQTLSGTKILLGMGDDRSKPNEKSVKESL